mmetsp:Transcript_49793/g.107848  ORF Transcript_49793/g.107848 Transcript_49793/m.107848 type:complete len:103 (-) Transcript_49793:405-713(-)
MNEPHNVMRRVQEEETIAARVHGVIDMNTALRDCAWHAGRERFDLAATKRHEAKRVALENEQANRVLLLERRARLKEFLAAEAEAFEAQLNDMGLAFAKERL